MTEGIADIGTIPIVAQKATAYLLKPGCMRRVLNYLRLFYFFYFNIQCDHRHTHDAMCSMANSVIHRAVQNYNIKHKLPG
jgi:hypothetical protein